jgi:hypothetical protein
MKKIHLRSLRLYVNARMQFPACKAKALVNTKRGG